MRAPRLKAMSSKAASSLVALGLTFAGCLDFRIDDKPFLCEGAACDGGVVDSGETDGGAAVDAGPGEDAGLDAGTDAGLDAGTDAGVDAGTDAGLDGGTDVGVDAGTDAGLDAGTDAGLDAGTDAGVDAGLDAGTDGGPDAGVDAGDPTLIVTPEGRWKMVPLPLVGGAGEFGAALALSADARTLVVGAPAAVTDGGSGRVFVFLLQGTNVTLLRFIDAPSAASRFGAAVSTTSDGLNLLVGAPGDVDGGPPGGAAWLFVSNVADGGLRVFPVPTGPRVSTGAFGASVSFAAASDVFAIGAPGQGVTDAGPRTGTVEVFRFDGGGLGLHSLITDSRLDAFDQFGASVSLGDDGTTLLIGAPGDDSDSTANNNLLAGAGAAYAFVRQGSSYNRQWVFKAGTPTLAGRYGTCVRVDSAGSVMLAGGERSGASAVDFEPWRRSFSVWNLDTGVTLPFVAGPGPSCFITSNAAVSVGAHHGQALIATTGQSAGTRVVTPPMAGTSSFGASLGGSPDGAVLLFGDPAAADGGVVWLLFR